MPKLARTTIVILLLNCWVYSFAQQQSQQATLRHQPPGTCPPAFPSCIFYGGDSDWNVVGGNISYLPVGGTGSPFGSAVYDNAVFASPTLLNGIFANVLVNPAELALYTTGYWEIRLGLQEGNPGTLIASGTCALSAVTNGQNVNSNIGVWFSCSGLSVSVPAGTVWYTLVPQAIGATKQIFEWTTSTLVPAVGTRQGICDTYITAPSCAYYISPLLGFGLENTLDTTPALPYPIAAGPSGAFSWGLF